MLKNYDILWSPWRKHYMSSLPYKNYENECFLCNRKYITDSKDEFMIIERGEYSFVMLNAWPYNPYHLLISPYDHIGDIINIDKNALYEIMDFIVKFKSLISELVHSNDFNIGCNIGKSSGAGVVGHMHMHLVPRWVGDTNFISTISDTRVISRSLYDISCQLKDILNN